MQSLESLYQEVSLNQEELNGILPGNFADYDVMKKKSSHVELATSQGIIKKSKRRSTQKALYEFLSLEVWYNLLNAYSANRDIKIRAPKPLGISNLNPEYPETFMEFLNGYDLRSLSKLKRTTPVNIRGQNEPLTIYAACALHLGALNAIKEREGILHEDFDTRHILFSPSINVFMGVIDVENSRADSKELVERESQKIYELFFRQLGSNKDKRALDSWYMLGKESYSSIKMPLRLPEIVEGISKKYNINFDFYNMSISGVHIKGERFNPQI